MVAFSLDGGALFAAGSYLDAAGTVQIRRWPQGTGAAVDIPVANDLVTSLVPTAAGLMFATAEPVLGIVDAANHARVVQAPRHIDFHDRAHTVIKLAPNGAGLEVALAKGKPQIMDVSARAFLRGDGAGKDFLPPVTSGFGMVVTDWRDSRTPKVNGQSMGLEAAETACSAAVSPAGAVVGTDFFVRFVGKERHWMEKIGGVAGLVGWRQRGRAACCRLFR